MDGGRFLAVEHESSPKAKRKEPGRSPDPSPCGSSESRVLSHIEKLLKADRREPWGEPLTADELLARDGRVFEPLFHEPPIGPVPEYLAPHLAVHGCVAEYEEKYEELDRWKARELTRWLKDGIGWNWCVAGKVYVLEAKKDEADAERFWFTLVEDRINPEG